MQLVVPYSQSYGGVNIKNRAGDQTMKIQAYPGSAASAMIPVFVRKGTVVDSLITSASKVNFYPFG